MRFGVCIIGFFTALAFADQPPPMGALPGDESCSHKVVFYALHKLLLLHPSLDCDAVREMRWREVGHLNFEVEPFDLGMGRTLSIRVTEEGTLGILIRTLHSDQTLYDPIVKSLSRGSLTLPPCRLQVGPSSVAYEWSPLREKEPGGLVQFFERLVLFIP